MCEKLLPDLDDFDMSQLSDVYFVMAKQVEYSLLSAGAVPGKDYTVLDLYRLAQPFVLEKFREGNVGWSMLKPR